MKNILRNTFLWCLLLITTAGSAYAQLGPAAGDRAGEPTTDKPPAGMIVLASPEQDCDNAIRMCALNGVYQRSQSYFGFGGVNEIPCTQWCGNGGTVNNPNFNNSGPDNVSGCLKSGERNAVWLRFRVTAAGMLHFRLRPTSLTGYYDWTMFKMNGRSCADIRNGVFAPIACNWLMSTSHTGMLDNNEVSQFGGDQRNFVDPIAVSVGDEFVIVLSNWSGTADGFIIDFNPFDGSGITPALTSQGGAAASIVDNVPPAGGALALNCVAKSFTFTFNEPINCADITLANLVQAGGNPTVLTGVTVTPVNCSGGYATSATITYSNPAQIAAGNYTLTFNNIRDVCDNVGSNSGTDAVVAPPALALSGSPTISCISASNQVTVRFNLNTPITCASVAAGDFEVRNSANGLVAGVISSVAPQGCGTTTSQILVTLNMTGQASDVYTLRTSASDPFLAGCNPGFLSGGPAGTISINYNYLAPIAVAASASTICPGDNSTLTLSGHPAAGASISWTGAGTPGGSPSGTTFLVTPAVTTTYGVTVTYGNCTRSATRTIVVAQPPIVSVTPTDVSLCAGGSANFTATSTINGSACTDCQYRWRLNGGAWSAYSASMASFPLNGQNTAGLYEFQVRAASGCIGTNTASAILSTPSSSPVAQCQVYYVAPGVGVSAGTSPSTPTTLADALSKANCNNATIKMAVGRYTLSAPVTVGSMVTIEGGYNGTFTHKTSNLTDAAAASSACYPNCGTTIIRNTTVDPGSDASGGNAPRVTAVIVQASSSAFTLSDLIIKVNTPAAGTRITSYGVYMGGGCSAYKINRCVVSATGANGQDGTNGVSASQTPANSGGNGANSSDGTAPAGPAGGSSGIGRAGGAGGRGGLSGNNAGSTGGTGQVAGSGGGAGGAGGPGRSNSTNDFGCDNPGATNRGQNGTAGSAGGDGANGSNGSAASYASGYFVPGSNGGDGTDAVDHGHGGGGGGGGGGQNDPCWICPHDYGGGGGGGGAGGAKAVSAGTGGRAGAGGFAIFTVSKGAGGTITDCQLSASGGSGGTGGTAGLGQPGGSGGTGGAQCDGGAGGNGGAGGRGGHSGSGGNAAAGASCLVCDLVGTSLNNVAHSNFALTTQPQITAQNISCTNTDLQYSTAQSSPSWSSLGAGATLAVPAASATPTTQYTTIGAKSLALDYGSSTTGTLTYASDFAYRNTTTVAIPDNNCSSSATSSIVVSGADASMDMANMTVHLGLFHNYRGDMEVYLIAPNGDFITLVNNRGGSTFDMNVILQDGAPANISTIGTTFNGVYRPDGAIGTCNTPPGTHRTTFGGFGTINPNGTWTLRVVDNVSGDAGSIQHWAISFGKSAPGSIPDNNCGSNQSRTINVSGMPTSYNAAGLEVEVDIAQSYIGDVAYYLVAPDGSHITLAHRLASTGCTADGHDVTFSDGAGSNITAAACPANWAILSGTYRPQGATTTCGGPGGTARANFAAFGATMNPNGNWTLRASDAGSGDRGAIIGFKINFTNTTISTTGSTSYSEFVRIAIPAPTLPVMSSNGTNVCSGSALNFTTSVAGNTGWTYNWTATTTAGGALPGGVSAAFSSSATVEAPVVTFTNTTGAAYTVRINVAVATECCPISGTVTPIDVVVQPQPAAPAVTTPVNVCPGNNYTLNATAPAGGTIEWFTAAAGGSSLGIGASLPMTAPLAPTSLTYYAEAISSPATGSCRSATRTPVTINVTGTLTGPFAAQSATLCAVTLSVNNVNPFVANPADPSVLEIAWFLASDAAEASLLGTGTTFVTPPLAGNTDYTVRITLANGCILRATTTAVPSFPANPTVGASSICSAGEASVTVSDPAPTPGIIYQFYANDGVTLLQSGGSNQFITPVLSTSTTYRVRIVQNGCNSNLVAATVTVGTGATTATWTNPGTGDWFDPANWNTAPIAGCLPSCATTVTINNGGTPQINSHPVGAQAGDISLGATSNIHFMVDGAKLNICGHFNHSGEVVNPGFGYIVFMGTANQNYNRSTDAANTLRGVQINNTVGITVTNENMVIGTTGTLEFVDGRITTTSTNEVVVQNTAPGAIQNPGANRFVNGRLRRFIDGPSVFTYHFPVGSGATYLPAELDYASASNVTEILCFNSAIDGAVLTPASSGNHCGPTTSVTYQNIGSYLWTFLPTPAAPTGMYTMRLWPGAIANPTQATITKRDNGASPWGLPGSCGTSTSAYLERDGLVGFSDAKGQEKSEPFPVELLELKATPLVSTIDVSWLTNMEVNNKGFFVERSLDAMPTNWNDIGWVDSKVINSTTPTTYSLEDANVAPNLTYYYRLRQVNLDGTFRYSNTVEARISSDNSLDVTLFPNPTDGAMSLQVSASQAEPLHVKFYNTLGQLVESRNFDLKLGVNTFDFNIDGLAAGSYNIVVSTGNKMYSTKVVKNK